MPIQVMNEISPLKRVMLHRPGTELEHLIPDTLERLLFDDIPYLRAAQAEHDCFAQVLRDNGVEVVYLEDLTAEALRQSKDLRAAFISDFIRFSGRTAQSHAAEITEYLSGIADEKQLVLKTMSGINFDEIAMKRSRPLVNLVSNEEHFITQPMPNLYFTRDPFASIGRGASINHMYSVTRSRETLYGAYVLQHHPDFAGKTPLYYQPHDAFHIEGGDILNLSERVLAVGISQRTQPEAIEQLAGNIFKDTACTADTILAFEIPRIRAFMHLDTVFTQVDTDKFTVHPGILQTLRAFEIKCGKKHELKVTELTAPLAEVLAQYLEVESVTLIKCGGQDLIAAQREQWNDGSNTLCIAPGKVVVYDRNDVTNELLEHHGVEVLRSPSSELSRGRGGPRCMSMPLWREI